MSKREATRKGIAFWLTLTTSIGGIIDGSVLKAVGLLLGFATIAQIPVIIEVAGYFRMTKGDLVIETSKEDRCHPLHHREDIVEQDDKAAGDEGID